MIFFNKGFAPDPNIQQVVDVIFSTYGDKVSQSAKGKNLEKFGRSIAIDNTGFKTIWIAPAGLDNENYVNTNIITQIVSDSALDTVDVQIEFHTRVGDDLVFGVQTVTLTGQTPVAITAACRNSRIKNVSTSQNLVGNVYVFEQGVGVTGGVPNDLTKVHNMVQAGRQQSEKCATSVSFQDYWAIPFLYSSMVDRSSGAIATVKMEIKHFLSSVWLPIGTSFTATSNIDGQRPFVPFRIVPKNYDARIVALGEGATDREVTAGIIGSLLLKVS